MKKPALSETDYLKQCIKNWEQSEAPIKEEMIKFYQRRLDEEERKMSSKDTGRQGLLKYSSD